MVYSNISIKTTPTITEQEYIDNTVSIASDRLAKQIDDEVMGKVLVDGGWTKVSFMYTNNKHAVDVQDWCMENLTDKQWMKLSDSYIFRKKKEAEWFILRWL